MVSSPNDSAAKHLRKMIAWLNCPRIDESEIGPNEPEDGERWTQFVWSYTRDRVMPLIIWLNGLQNEKSPRALLRLVNSTLEQWYFYPHVDAARPGAPRMITWLTAMERLQSPLIQQGAPWVQQTLHAFSRGWLVRLRRCAYAPCSQWFDAEDPRKQFHTPRCRKRAYDRDPRERAKKRKYMKRYMRDYRARNS